MGKYGQSYGQLSNYKQLNNVDLKRSIPPAYRTTLFTTRKLWIGRALAVGFLFRNVPTFYESVVQGVNPSI